MSAHVHLCFLWHQHQPCYRDLLTGQFILPWVRLHGIKDYFGMAAILEECPAAHATINLVPSLIEQLETYLSRAGEDRVLTLSRRSPSALEPEERQLLLRFLFMAHPDHMIRPLPRYAELWERTEYGNAPPEKAARRFSDQDYRDLQVLANLVWFHPLVIEREPELASLRRKGRDFTEGDKAFVLAKQMEILGRILPLHKALADRGQIEISTSPYYHPILPLLCNMESAREAMPNVQLPSMQRNLRVDAERQVQEALALHERVFGRRPSGMWPSEGSVSDDVVSVAGSAGLRWMATDEAILSNSLGQPLYRDPYGHLVQPDLLCRPYRREMDGVSIWVVFRNAVLSNLLSFDYQRSAPADAAEDFIRRIETIRDGLPPGEWIVSIALDGENPWEHYPGNGVEFLRRLYDRLTRIPGVSLSTVTEAVDRASAPGVLPHLYAGSWINHNFHVWVGHKEDQRAWEALNRVREFVRAASRTHGWTEESVRKLGFQGGYAEATPEPTRRELDLAWRCVFAAEGSDWYWWYGDDFTSALDGDFDTLFRRHLMNAYHALKHVSPAELSRPLKERVSHPVFQEPAALLRVTVDGRSTNYFEWIGAGHYDSHGDMSSMGRSGHPQIGEVFYGFDEERFYLRIDPSPETHAENLLKDEGVQVVFIQPRRRFIRLQGAAKAVQARVVDPEKTSAEKPVQAAADAVIELGCPFADLGFHAGENVEFFLEGNAVEGQRIRYPAGTTLRFSVPTEDYEKVFWHV